MVPSVKCNPLGLKPFQWCNHLFIVTGEMMHESGVVETRKWKPQGNIAPSEESFSEFPHRALPLENKMVKTMDFVQGEKKM